MAGLKCAGKNGRIGGKKKSLSPEAEKKAFAAWQLNERNIAIEDRTKKLSIPDIAKTLHISRGTFYRYLDWAKQQQINTNGKKKRSFDR